MASGRPRGILKSSSSFSISRGAIEPRREQQDTSNLLRRGETNGPTNLEYHLADEAVIKHIKTNPDSDLEARGAQPEKSAVLQEKDEDGRNEMERITSDLRDQHTLQPRREQHSTNPLMQDTLGTLTEVDYYLQDREDLRTQMCEDRGKRPSRWSVLHTLVHMPRPAYRTSNDMLEKKSKNSAMSEIEALLQENPADALAAVRREEMEECQQRSGKISAEDPQKKVRINDGKPDAAVYKRETSSLEVITVSEDSRGQGDGDVTQDKNPANSQTCTLL